MGIRGALSSEYGMISILKAFLLLCEEKEEAECPVRGPEVLYTDADRN